MKQCIHCNCCAICCLPAGVATNGTASKGQFLSSHCQAVQLPNFHLFVQIASRGQLCTGKQSNHLECSLPAEVYDASKGTVKDASASASATFTQYKSWIEWEAKRSYNSLSKTLQVSPGWWW